MTAATTALAGGVTTVVDMPNVDPPPNTAERFLAHYLETLVPGLWDSHLHIGDDWSVLANIASGITSFRSPGTDIERAVDATKRRNSGDLLMGEPFIAHIIDQKHPLAAQGAEVVGTRTGYRSGRTGGKRAHLPPGARTTPQPRRPGAPAAPRLPCCEDTPREE